MGGVAWWVYNDGHDDHVNAARLGPHTQIPGGSGVGTLELLEV